MGTRDDGSTQPRAGATEKITVNLGVVDLGQVDLLVQQGVYANRTDLIRSAIRKELSAHAEVVRQATARQTLQIGLRHYDRAELEALRETRETLELRVLGLLSIAPDVTPELALATIASLHVLGAFHASPEVKAALTGRMR